MKILRLTLITLFLLQIQLYAKDPRVEQAGDVLRILLPSITLGTTYYLDDTKGQIEFYKSFLGNIATTFALKYTIKEKRPNSEDTDSFPSGHTSVSFQSASFIHIRYGLNYAVPAYIASTFVAYSRVYAQKHYTRDVIAGALLGSAFSYLFTTPYVFKALELKPLVFTSIKNQNQLYGVQIQW